MQKNKKKIFIHIGCPKTGTTAIQSFLTMNHDALKKAGGGVFFPLMGNAIRFSKLQTGRTTHEFGEDGDKNAYFYQNGCLLYNPVYTQKSKRMLKWFAKSKYSTLLLSDEALSEWQAAYKHFNNNPELFDLLSEFELKFIVYFRQSAEYLATRWQTDLIAHFLTQFRLETHLDEYDYKEDILDNIHALSKKVGKENIIARVYEKESWVNQDLIDDFLAILGIKKENDFQRLNHYPNAAISRIEAERLFYIQKNTGIIFNYRDKYNILNNVLNDHHGQRIIDSLPDELIKKATDKYYGEECKIAQEFFGRDELFKNKYPKIYGTARKIFDYDRFIKEEKQDLQFIVNSVLQREMIDSNKKLCADIEEIKMIPQREMISHREMIDSNKKLYADIEDIKMISHREVIDSNQKLLNEIAEIKIISQQQSFIKKEILTGFRFVHRKLKKIISIFYRR